MIEIHTLSKVYSLKPVLRKISFNVAAGEFVCLLGPNGAGKTTLLRIISTLLRPTTGQVRVAGLALPTYANAVRGLLGLVGHNPLLYTDLTAGENLQLYAHLYDLPNAAQRIDEVLRRVGLHKRRTDLVRNFSRGMQQRLAIARATLHSPRVMLCDEPHTGLDPQASDMLDEILKSIAADGCAVLMTTHDLQHGVALADRVLVLNKGSIVFDRPTTDIDPGTFHRTFAEIIYA